MKSFRELSESMAKRIDRAMLGLAGIGSLDELESGFLEAAGRILPADCICWNNWRQDWGGILSQRCNAEEYAAWFDKHLDSFGEVVGYWRQVAP